MKSGPDHDSHLSSVNDHSPLEPFILDILGPRLIESIVLIGSGGHGRVFRLNLRGHTYALKLFFSTNPLAYTTIRRGQHSESTLRTHYDPFFAECRAYASIIAHGANGTFAPFCYGSVMIDRALELRLGRLYPEHSDWNRQPEQGNECVKGILTEFFDGVELAGVELTREVVGGVRDGVEGMNKIGIVHGDVFPKNVLVSTDKRVVWIDFSASWTLPHIVGDLKYQDRQKSDRKSVELMFHVLSLVGLIIPHFVSHLLFSPRYC
ncbi:hypothetical protein GP486_003295 [Trichoglossum hirsutum]|uniref:Protein kinase domain-containing protein n=1 Tax=Trichoglossum hirsutum TaxID=265104 RepID=A0A9P8RQU7_9PEZI|nr:hypothetical protein GP486_003295 [Trichoglossum hirsutum]